MEKLVKHSNRMQREVVQSPSLKGLKDINVTLRDMV